MVRYPVLLLLSVLAVSASQDKPQPPRQVLRTAANLVRVDIHVLKDGRPIADLTEDDFEILEDGVRQKIDTLEFVRAEAPQSAVPVEPANTRAMLDLAADPRNRVFIFFLDVYHVTQENSLLTPMALVRLIDSLVGPTDLIGVMTPDMAASQLTLARKTDVIRRGLLDNQRWGRMQENCRDRGNLDQMEQMYSVCYPPESTKPESIKCDLSTAALELIRRTRESFTLGVLRDTVRYIGSTRDARTAFVLVSEGWPLYRPSRALADLGAADPPTIRIGPGGTLGTKNPGDFNVDKQLCAQHLRAAAQLDDDQLFRDLMDDANRNNASFYIVDPGGLRTDMWPIDSLPGQIDPRGHVDTLRTLAENTDGDAIVNTNDIKGGLLRVVDDLWGYYLVGYYSTNTKNDGGYRSIKVKVGRPGVDVRSRKGYRAWTADEVKAMTAARTAAAAPADRTAEERTTALGRLARLRPDTPFYVHAVIDGARSEMHVVGELASSAARAPEWRQGAEAQIMVDGPDGSPTGTGRATIPQGGRAFLARIALSGTVTSGTHSVEVWLKAAGGSTLLGTAQVPRVAGVTVGEPIAFRTATRLDPVATFLWRRTDAARFEAPLSADAPVPAARLLDRAGSPMAVPVDVTVREEASGRWAVATVALAPLAPGDYLLEITADSTRRLVPLRVER